MEDRGGKMHGWGRAARGLAAGLLAIAAMSVPVEPRQGSDLDTLMREALAQRARSRNALFQYVLNEREDLQVTGPGAVPIYGFRREYLWYPRAAAPPGAAAEAWQFIRSPLSADGVAIGEDDRRRAEEAWAAREARRAAAREGAPLEPGFVSTAWFLDFVFEPGRYALAGHEPIDGRDALRIEYYPAQMFRQGRTRPNRRIRERDPDAARRMNQVSLVTLWVDAAEPRILRYEYENVDMDFLPGQSILRWDGATARMEMGEPFAGVWLPRRLEVVFGMTLAAGQVTGRYVAEYVDYRAAEVTTRIR